MKADKTEIIANIKLTDFLGMSLKERVISPIRMESHPSFNVFVSKCGFQLWKDHGSGQFGDIIQLYCLYHHVDFPTACRELSSGQPRSIPIQRVSNSGSGNIQNDPRPKTPEELIAEGYSVRSHTPVSMSRYIKYTGLPVPSWLTATADFYTDSLGHLCLPNISGGIHLKGGFLINDRTTFTTNVGHTDISVFGNYHGVCCIFEGVGDLLALVDGVTGIKHERSEYLYVVMNSANNISSLITYLQNANHNHIELYLDLDKKGEETTALLLELFPTAVDRRALITVGKDLRDTWSEQKLHNS